jgi:hypothetical protein
MYVKKITEMKEHLDELKKKGLVEAWELPYENLLTRLNAAIFFISPAEKHRDYPAAIWTELEGFEHFSYRINHEKKLSSLTYRVTFSEEEKQKNMLAAAGELVTKE